MPDQSSDPRLLRLRTVADRLDVGLRTIRRLVANGELDLINVGTPERPQWRMSEESLRRYIDSRVVPGRS